MVPLVFQRILGVAAVAAAVMLDAAQSIPAPPGHSLDTTEMYYLANESDDATSSYRPLKKKARTSSGAASPKAQQVQRPPLDLNKVPSTSSLDTTELYYGAHVPFEEGATSAHPPAAHRKAEPVRGLPTAHTQRVHDPVKGKAVALSSSSSSESSRKRKHASQVSSSGSSVQGSARSTSSSSGSHSWQTSQASQEGHSEHVQVGSKGQLSPQHATPFTPSSLVEHNSNLGHESEDIRRRYKPHGIIQAKVKAIQEHAPHYPGRPEEYPYIYRGKNSGQSEKELVEHRVSAYRLKTRETYDRMAANQNAKRPLLDGVIIPSANVARPAGERQQQQPQPPTSARLADYRRFLTAEALKTSGYSQRQAKQLLARTKATPTSRPGVLPHHSAVANPGGGFRERRSENARKKMRDTDKNVARMVAAIQNHDPAFPGWEDYVYQPTVPVVGGAEGEQKLRRNRFISKVRHRYTRLRGKGLATPSEQSKGTKSHRR